MRKIFASKKAKKKPGDYKVPVPMVGGIHNAKLSAAELDTILTGRQEPNGVRKPVSSVSTVTRHSHQNPIPARPISSPPALAMPKPRRPVRQAESLLRSQDFDKTQIESSSESEEPKHMHEEEEEHESPVDIDASVLVLWPENWTDRGGLAHPVADVPLLSNKLQRQQLLAAPDEPHERFEEISLLQDHPPAPAEQPVDLVNPSNQQRSGVVSVTSSSEDSNLQYDSARQSPLISVSSEQTPDNTSMDLLKKQLSQASSDHHKPVKILSSALLIDDDEPEPIPTSMQLQQTSSDASTPKLPYDVVQKLVAPNKTTTAESSSTSSNTVSPLLHAKITSTAVYPLPVPELPPVAAPATVNVTPGYQKSQLPKQCDDNEPSHVVVASRPEVPSSLSQEQRPDHNSFSMSLEALKRQVDLMQKQREIEHQQWEQREMEHREREKIMLDKIRETQIQLEQALTQQLLTMTASDAVNGGGTSTMPRTRQSSRPSSRKGKETRDENGEPYHFTDQEDPSAWDTNRGQRLRQATTLRSKSSETPRSTAYWDKRKDRETWKSSGVIRQQPLPQTIKESHSYTTFVDPIRGSKGQLYVGRRNQNEDIFFNNGQRSQNTVIANQRHEQLQAHDDTDTSTSPDDEHFTILGGRKSRNGSAASVPLYGKNSVENSPHGSNISAKSDGPVNRRNRKGVGRSTSQERRRRSRSYSAPESPQDYHSALEDEEYEEAFEDYQNSTRTSRTTQQRPSPTEHYHTGRRDRRSKPPSSSTTRRRSPSMYEDPRSARLAAHMSFLPHQPTSHRNRRRRDSQRMMDGAFLDEEMYHAAYLAGIPPPIARLPRGMHPPPPPPPPPGMPYHDDWSAGLTPGGWPPSIYRVAPPSSFSSSGTDSYQEASNMMETGQPGLFRRYSNRGANGSSGGGPPSQQQTFPVGGLRQARMHPAMYQHPSVMDGPPSMSFR